MFKKLLGGFILAFAFLLSGCGGDNGELAGTYIEKILPVATLLKSGLSNTTKRIITTLKYG